MIPSLVGLPCPFCRRPRQVTRTIWCGPGGSEQIEEVSGCEVTEEVWSCDCDGGRWRLRADLLLDDGHTPECAEATAREWMRRNVTVNCALNCGRPGEEPS